MALLNRKKKIKTKTGAKNKNMGRPHYKPKKKTELETIVFETKWGERLRNQIRKRDKHQCRECGKSQKKNKEKLTVHHINYKKDDNDPGNLISLCWECHKKAHPKAKAKKDACSKKYRDMLKENSHPIVKVEDDEEAIKRLKEAIRGIDKKVTRNQIAFLMEYIRNGCNGTRAYQFVFPGTSVTTAQTMSSLWLKKIDLSELLHMTGLGFGRIVDNINALGPDRQLFYLMQLHKLNGQQLDVNVKQEVIVITPPYSQLPAPVETVGKNPKEIIVKKKTTKEKGVKQNG